MLHKQSKSNLQLRKNNQGMTLIEVIAVVAVLGVVMAAVLGFMITGAKMSAKVSGTATDSIKEQTAVENINRWILRHGQSDLELVPVEQATEGGTITFNALEIRLTNETVAVLTVEENMIVYQQYDLVDGSRTLQNSIELCPGRIDFIKIDTNTNTVTYMLNDKDVHVVHLRVAGQP